MLAWLTRRSDSILWLEVWGERCLLSRFNCILSPCICLCMIWLLFFLACRLVLNSKSMRRVPNVLWKLDKNILWTSFCNLWSVLGKCVKGILLADTDIANTNTADMLTLWSDLTEGERKQELENLHWEISCVTAQFREAPIWWIPWEEERE